VPEGTSTPMGKASVPPNGGLVWTGNLLASREMLRLIDDLRAPLIGRQSNHSRHKTSDRPSLYPRSLRRRLELPAFPRIGRNLQTARIAGRKECRSAAATTGTSLDTGPSEHLGAARPGLIQRQELSHETRCGRGPRWAKTLATRFCGHPGALVYRHGDPATSRWGD